MNSLIDIHTTHFLSQSPCEQAFTVGFQMNKIKAKSRNSEKTLIFGKSQHSLLLWMLALKEIELHFFIALRVYNEEYKHYYFHLFVIDLKAFTRNTLANFSCFTYLLFFMDLTWRQTVHCDHY